MDPTQTSDTEILALVEKTITPDELNKLTLYALYKLGQIRWRGVWSGKVPGGVQAEDLAMSAIEALLVGNPKKGGRVWVRQKQPDLLMFLRDVVDSKVNHLAERSENKSEREPKPADGESEADFLDRKRDTIFDPEGAEPNSDEEEANERLFFALLEEVKHDALLQKILECHWDGISGRAEVAAKLGVDPNDITLAKKRLDRIVPEFRKKYADMNPFQNP